MKPKGAKQKKPYKADKVVLKTFSMPESYYSRYDKARKGLSRGKYLMALIDITSQS